MSDRSLPRGSPVDLAGERAALIQARQAVQVKLAQLATIRGGGADEYTDEYIAAMVSYTVERLQQELVVFGRIDDDDVWRVGLYGIDSDGRQLVVDWRAPFAEKFYQAGFDAPLGLVQRVSYVGSIDDLLVENFATGSVHGSSPLMAELSRSRGETMRTAVATLQSEQDRLVRLPAQARLVLRGGPGTGKTVVGLHRAAWLVYNNNRITADRILVLGPSDRFLRYVATVLPTLGEAKVLQTTVGRLFGESTEAGNDPRWLELLDRFEDGLVQVERIRIGGRGVPAEEMSELVTPFLTARLPWRDRRRLFVEHLAARFETRRANANQAIATMWPPCSAQQAWRRLRNRKTLQSLGADDEFIERWLAVSGDGSLLDEVRARFDGVPARYSHIIVDEAQDISLFTLRAVIRRADGLTLVGDDAQRSNPFGIGLRAAAQQLEVEPEEMNVAYRMSAEIATWLNQYAAGHGIEAITLDGIRPTGVAVRRSDDVGAAEVELRRRWSNVAVISADGVWEHKGVEYDAVVVDGATMTPAEVYLAASRAAHELVTVGV